MAEEIEIQPVSLTEESIRREHQELACRAGEIAYLMKIKEAESLEIFKRMQALNHEMAKLLAKGGKDENNEESAQSEVG